MQQLSVFIPVSFSGINSLSKQDKAIEFIDAIFDFSGKKAIVFPGDNEHGRKVFLQENQKSYAEMTIRAVALGVVGYLNWPALGSLIAVKLYLRTSNHFSICDDPIRSFWEDEIKSFKISHGTSSIYKNHFNKHGISATYPPELSSLITGVRKVWEDHEKDITPKTGYFRWFEERYDKALKNQGVEISFTANDLRINEYTVGQRGFGGEWCRELHSFLDIAKRNQGLLRPTEHEILLNAEAFLDVIKTVPAMTVEVSYVDIGQEYHPNLQSFEDFERRVKRECPEWENPNKLKAFLDALLPKIQKSKADIKSSYSITVHQTIPATSLHCKLIPLESKYETPISAQYPHIPYDVPTHLKNHEICSLCIDRDGLSKLCEYADSIFKCEHINSQYGEGSNWIVTRRKISNLNSIESDKYERVVLLERFRKEWLQVFKCQ